MQSEVRLIAIEMQVSLTRRGNFFTKGFSSATIPRASQLRAVIGVYFLHGPNIMPPPVTMSSQLVAP